MGAVGAGGIESRGTFAVAVELDVTRAVRVPVAEAVSTTVTGFVRPPVAVSVAADVAVAAAGTACVAADVAVTAAGTACVAGDVAVGAAGAASVSVPRRVRELTRPRRDARGPSGGRVRW